MGTEATAQTILQGATLTSNANSELNKSIIQGFGNLQQSIKYGSDLMNQMVQATIDVKKTEIDEHYKTESLKLQSEQIAAQKAHYEADLEYKKSYLEAQKERAQKQASLAPLVGAIGKEATALTQKEADIDKQLRILQTKRDGSYFNEKGDVVLSGTLPVIEGSPEYESITSQINSLTKEKEKLGIRKGDITAASTAVNLGADPEEVRRMYYPNLMDNKREGPNPLLPPANSQDSQSVDSPDDPSFEWDVDRNKRLDGQVPNQDYPSYDPQAVDAEAASQIGPPKEAMVKQELMGPPKPFWYSRSAYDNFISLSKRASSDKQPLPYGMLQQMLGRMNPNDQKKILQETGDVVKGYAVSLGDVLAKEASGDRSSKDDIDILNNTYRGQMTNLGFDPNSLDIAASKVRQAVIGFKLTEPYRNEVDNSKKAGMINTYVFSNVDLILGNKKAEVAKTPDILGDIKPVDSSKYGDFAQGPNGEPIWVQRDEVDIKTENAVKLHNEFINKFIDEKGSSPALADKSSQSSGFPVNSEYLSWIKSFKNPEDFGIIPPASKDKSSVKGIMEKMVNSKIREIINDPQKAYYFWLEKMKNKEQQKTVPGFNEFSKDLNSEFFNSAAPSVF